jgi:hypothetical protein
LVSGPHTPVATTAAGGQNSKGNRPVPRPPRYSWGESWAPHVAPGRPNVELWHPKPLGSRAEGPTCRGRGPHTSPCTMWSPWLTSRTLAWSVAGPTRQAARGRRLRRTRAGRGRATSPLPGLLDKDRATPAHRSDVNADNGPKATPLQVAESVGEDVPTVDGMTRVSPTGGLGSLLHGSKGTRRYYARSSLPTSRLRQVSRGRLPAL